MNVYISFYGNYIIFGGIPGPLTVESEGLWGALHKNEQVIISLLVGGGYPQYMIS